MCNAENVYAPTWKLSKWGQSYDRKTGPKTDVKGMHWKRSKYALQIYFMTMCAII